MKIIKALIVFFILNFGALALGGLFAGQGASSDWYDLLNRAPWTPPGWVFGFAWTSIMICYAIYMAIAWNKISNRKKLLILYVVQWILNVSWNPSFFYYHEILLGLLIIISLIILIGFFFFGYWKSVGYYSLLLLPYLIWLCIASSLNGYAYFMN